jgi:carbonic anhydrase
MAATPSTASANKGMSQVHRCMARHSLTYHDPHLGPRHSCDPAREFIVRKQIVASLMLILVSAAGGCKREEPARSPGAGVPAVQTKESQAAMTPTEALSMLREGNARFVAGQPKLRNLPAEVAATASAQYPFAVILSCLDSRQSAELIFDQGIGDVFNARVAGNILDEDILGSLEFGCKVSGSKLILVLGHSNCGAVKGAVDGVELAHLTGLLDRIKPAIAAVTDVAQSRDSKNADFVQKVAVANVRLVMKQIREQSPILREMLDRKAIGLSGGMYDLSTGRVEFLPD